MFEDGKLRALPIKLPNLDTNEASASSSTKPLRKKFPLQPLKLPIIDDIKSSPNLRKLSFKMPNSRKDLFKVPSRVSQNKTLLSRQSIAKKSSRLTISKPSILRASKRGALIALNDTPLIDVDEAERIIRKGSRRNVEERIKSVLFPVINNNPIEIKNAITKKYFEKAKGSIELSNSDEEFLRLEEKLEDKENNGEYFF